MAKLKIGENIKINAEISAAPLPPGNIVTLPDPKLESMEVSIHKLAAQVTEVSEEVQGLMSAVNELDVPAPQVIEKTITKQGDNVVVHKDHSKDLKNIRDSILFVEKNSKLSLNNISLRSDIISERVDKVEEGSLILHNELNKSKAVTKLLIVGLIISTLLHLI